MDAEYGVLMVFIYINVTVNGNRAEKRVTLLNKQNVTKEEGTVIFQGFKKENPEVAGICARWQPDSVFMG
jgi:hypothetical protein